MLTALNDWSSALNDKLRTVVIYFHFIKAFDKVTLPKLLLEANKIGTHPMVVRRVREFLPGSTFQARINHGSSSGFRFTALRRSTKCIINVCCLYYLSTPVEIPQDSQYGAFWKIHAQDMKLSKAIKMKEDPDSLQAATNYIDQSPRDWELPLFAEKIW